MFTAVLLYTSYDTDGCTSAHKMPLRNELSDSTAAVVPAGMVQEKSRLVLGVHHVHALLLSTALSCY